MSKGPGRLERLIHDTFTANPSETFTIEQLARLAYPGVNRIEKKHTVAVARAARKVADQDWWRAYCYPKQGSAIVYANLCNVRSYTIGKVLYDGLPWRSRYHGETIESMWEDVENGTDKSWSESILPDGAFSDHVAINIAKRDGVEVDPVIRARQDVRNVGSKAFLDATAKALGR